MTWYLDGLVSLSDFPHVADYFILDENEKIMKSVRRLNEEIKRRKKILSEARVVNLNQYNQVAEEKIPSIYLFIDSYDGMAETKYVDAFNDMLSTVARDGVSLGMYLVVTLSRVNAMRLQLQANFKTKISLFLFDNSDLSAIVGRSNIPLEEIKGRAVVKFDEIIHFQIAQPYKYDSYVDYIEQVKTKKLKIWQSIGMVIVQKSIPMLPEKNHY